MNPQTPLSRRRFLGQANCAAISSLPILNTLLNLQMAGSIAEAQGSDNGYRAVVCLFLGGGMDSFNLLVPYGPTEYAEYAAERASLALPQNQLLPITPLNNVGRQLGLHPGVPELQTLFQNGNLAFIANVGTLVQPTTLTTYNNGAASLPLGLFSHSDQTEQWQSSTPYQRSGIGWAGRMADVIKSVNTNQVVSMNISLSGSNVWQTGNSVFEYAITQDGATAMTGYEQTWQQEYGQNQLRSAAVDGLLALQYANLLQQSYASTVRSSLDAYNNFANATNVTLPSSVTFPSTTLAQQLKMVCKAVAGHAGLGMTRNTFFISYGGWDHHSSLIANQAEMLPIVSQAVGAFYNMLVAMNMQNSVVLYVATDFGRSLTSNGSGSDHAWGGNSFAVGGPVIGKTVYGQFPSLYNNNPLDVGRGRLIPTTSVDQYFAEMALWLGVSKSNLPLVLPNIGSFYDITSSSPPIGFLG
jgi:uncharacterized protein (DUF1501 family)